MRSWLIQKLKQPSASRESKPLGTCGPLSLLRAQLQEPFLLMNGDILTTMNFQRFFAYGCAQESDFTIATKNVGTPFNFGKVHTEGNRIVKVEEKPQFLTEVVAGIYFMRPAIFELIPNDTYFGIDDLIEKMLAAKRSITRYLMEEYWLDIGRVSFIDVTREKRAAQWGRLVDVMSWSGQPPVVRLCGSDGDSDKSGGGIRV